ncbi:TolC family protein [Pelomonas sp. SE-A7]|uniref:TolC family protein n=1 Tax=Pelomonas sp. SE-A7 TaxID=3054953 RepID=UPI00259C7160|nr:TolC family protein [Pelomonas sp. SE-A7]MDM4765564.1 TolC family protein [Pelomonas sp. SE-A7]
MSPSSLFKPHRLALAAALSLLAGCSGLPVKPGQAPQDSQALPAQWSMAFTNAAAMASVEDAELAALQARALQSNRDLQLTAMRMADALAQARVDGQRLSADLSLSASRSVSRQLGGDRGYDSTTKGHGFNAMAGYEVDLWGRLAMGDRLREQQNELRQADLQAARALLLAQVASRHWQLGNLVAQKPLLDEILAQAEEALAITRLRVREGKLLPIEVDRAAAAVQSARLRRSDLDLDLVQQRQQLALLLDEMPVGEDSTRRAGPPAAAPAPLTLGAPATVLEQRLDVRRARLSVDAALVQLKLSETARYPSLNLVGNVSSGSSDWKDWLDRPLATLSASLIVPLVSWPRLELQRELSRSGLDQAALGLRDTLHKALVEIDGRLIETRRLQQQEDALRLRLDEARQAEKIAALKLELGLINRLDWLQARNARLSTDHELMQLRLRQWQAHAELCASLGMELRAR